MNSPGAMKLGLKDFRKLSRFIYEEFGINLSEAKRTLLESRLRKRIIALGFASYTDYCNYLLSPEGLSKEPVQMIDLVTTNKTEFYREADHFEFLYDKILPEWLKQHGNGRQFQLWSAGCSSGEEPYTLSIELTRFMGEHRSFSFSIWATDISNRILEKAKKAVYSEEALSKMPVSLKKQFFLRSRNRDQKLVRVVSGIRKQVKFSRLNLMDIVKKSPGKFPVIFCRNVLIYFDRKTQIHLIEGFANSLEPDGYLFLGHSETIMEMDLPLKKVAPTVYQKISIQ